MIAGAGQLAVEAQKELVLGTRQALRGIEQGILLDAVSAYMQVRADTEFRSAAPKQRARYHARISSGTRSV